MLTVHSPSVTITFKGEELLGQAVADIRFTIMSPPDGAMEQMAAAGTRLSASHDGRSWSAARAPVEGGAGHWPRHLAASHITRSITVCRACRAQARAGG
jgi:hypothetical protein